jgi:hypothetical protein
VKHTLARASALGFGLLLLSSSARAQITHMVAQFDGSQVVPPTASTAQGSASFVLEPGNLELGYRVGFDELSSGGPVWHLHGPASASQNAPIVFPLTSGTGNCGLEFLDPPVNTILQAGSGYVDVHSTLFPNGEIRGQVVLAPSLGTASCFGDGSDGPCPCGNAGAPGRGCENSAGTGGARLTASGLLDPDLAVLIGSGLPSSSLVVFLQGDATIAAVPFGDGLRCVGGTLLRLDGEVPFQGWVSYPHGCDAPIQYRSEQLGQPILPGDTRSYQLWYRDAAAGYCPPPIGNNWNVTNAVTITW